MHKLLCYLWGTVEFNNNTVMKKFPKCLTVKNKRQKKRVAQLKEAEDEQMCDVGVRGELWLLIKQWISEESVTV